MGAAGIALLGMLIFNEPAEFWRIACLSLIVMGVIGLKMITPATH
jgi:quaternary ammonium compound-resistance protein SugE